MSHVTLPANLGQRFFPEIDAVTAEEYHRLTPPTPVPLTPRAAPTMIPCARCGTMFIPHKRARAARFCNDRCRRLFHAHLSWLRKKQHRSAA